MRFKRAFEEYLQMENAGHRIIKTHLETLKIGKNLYLKVDNYEEIHEYIPNPEPQVRGQRVDEEQN
jgi:hypothetical protein